MPFLVSIVTAQCDWNSTAPNTISLVKGKSYLTSQENLAIAKRSGWLLVISDVQQGYVPLMYLQACKTDNHSLEAQIQDNIPNVSFNSAPSNSIPEQMKPKLSTPVTDVHGNPIALPHPLVDKSNIGRR